MGSLKYHIKSFKFAFNGLAYFFKTEKKAWIHTGLAFLAITMGLLLSLSPHEWCLITFAILCVLVTEIFNSTIENLVDLIHPEKAIKAGNIKDMAAGAVLFSAVGAFVVGLIIYLPKIISLLN
jgi:diacylglycerol kinase (ATP)